MGPNDSANSRLSEADIEEMSERIAERAAQKAVEKLTHMVYAEVGKGVLKKMLFLIGAAVVGAVLWAKEHNWLTGH